MTLQKKQIIDTAGFGYDGDHVKLNGVDDIVVSLGGIYKGDPYYSEYQAMNLTMQNLTSNNFEPVKVSTYERQINFDSLFSTMAMTMVHLTLLNNWQVTFDAVVVAFGAAHETQFGKQSRNVARALAFCYFISFIIIQVVIVLNILISWFFEVYSNYFQQEHEVLRHRAEVMEEHKNESHHETHPHHHHDVEKSLSRLFRTLKRPVRPPVCHVSHVPFSKRWYSTRGPCTMETCDVCLRPTRIPSPCKGFCTPRKDRETPRIQWIMAPKFIHVVLQVSHWPVELPILLFFGFSVYVAVHPSLGNS